MNAISTLSAAGHCRRPEPAIWGNPGRLHPRSRATTVFSRTGCVWGKFIGGFKLYVEDRADLGYDALYQNLQGVISKSSQTRVAWTASFSTFTSHRSAVGC